MSSLFFFNDTATTEIYTLSLHDALPISIGILMLLGIVTKNAIMLVDFGLEAMARGLPAREAMVDAGRKRARPIIMRSEEHTSELQSRQYLVCRLLLEKKLMAPFCAVFVQ